MSKDNKTNPDEITIEIGTDGNEAYATLVQWVKTVPQTLEELKKNGTEEEVKQFQLQIKMVLEKLKAIERELNQDA